MKIYPTFPNVAGGFIRTIHAFLATTKASRNDEGEVAAAMSLDPVCGKWVPTGSMALFSNSQGRKIFFCSEVCKLTFDCDPGQS